MVFSLGRTAENMKANLKMTRDTVMVYTPGLMAESTTVLGHKESNMDKENISCPMVNLELVSGTMELESVGLMKEILAMINSIKCWAMYLL